MKSKLGGPSECCVEKPFPKLVMITNTSSIFLMKNKDVGIRVASTNTRIFPIGVMYNPACRSEYRDYEGSVTLCNG